MKPRQIAGRNYTQRARGRAIAPLPSILLSNASVASTASIGDTIGTLSVVGGTGTYTFTLTSNPGTLFAIDTPRLKVGAVLSAGSKTITVHADNGAGSVISQSFSITVT